MRRRSNTIYAENVAEFTEKANDTQSASAKPRRLSTKKKINASSLLPLLFTEDQKREELTEKDSQFWSGFDFDMERSKTVPNEKSDCMAKGEFCRGNFQDEGSCCTDSTEDTMCSSPDSTRRCVTRKFMVIGMGGTGRHALVNSIFDSQGKEEQSSLRQTMDLIIKTKKETSHDTKYHFWMKALDDNKFDGLIKVYYRIASVFFFVYSVTDRDSFEKLNEAIEAVLKEVPREKFVGVLLGNKCDLEEQRQVDISEGVALKEKYNLSLFLETHQEDKSKDQLFSVLKNQA